MGRRRKISSVVPQVRLCREFGTMCQSLLREMQFDSMDAHCMYNNLIRGQNVTLSSKHADRPQSRRYSSGAPEPEGTQASRAEGPLKGYKVLDLSQVVAGNFCGALLGYFGADVIKIEPPGKGDPLRSLRAMDEDGATSLWFRSYGRNKKSVTLDLKNEKSKEVIKALANKCHVIIENFRPGVMEKWGIGPKDLGDHLVWGRISGYGQSGPKASMPGYASVCEAYGGFRFINGYSDRAPVRPNMSLGDTLAGQTAALGVLAALLAQKTRDGNEHPIQRGQGQVVDAAISESMFNMLEGCVPEYFAKGAVRPCSGSTLTDVVPSGCWKSKDGVYVIIGGNGDSVYNRLMVAISRPDMTTDNPRYETDPKRCEVEKEIVHEIEKWVASNEASQIIKTLNEARVPAGPILSIKDIAEEEQYQVRGMFEKTSPPGSKNSITVPAMLPKLSRTPGRTHWAGPDLGHHTVDVLQEELGLNDAQIDELRSAGAI